MPTLNHPLPQPESNQLDRSPAAMLPMTTNILVVVCDKVPVPRQFYEIDHRTTSLVLQSLPSSYTLLQFNTGPASSHCILAKQRRHYLPSPSLDRMPTTSLRPSSSLLSNRGATTCLCQMHCSLDPNSTSMTSLFPKATQQHREELQDGTQCTSSSSLTGEFKSKQGWRDAAAPVSFRAGSTAHAQLL